MMFQWTTHFGLQVVISCLVLVLLAATVTVLWFNLHEELEISCDIERNATFYPGNEQVPGNCTCRSPKLEKLTRCVLGQLVWNSEGDADAFIPSCARKAHKHILSSSLEEFSLLVNSDDVKKGEKTTMMAHQHSSWIFVNDRTFVTGEQLNSLLKNYNIFYGNQKNLHILYGQTEEGKLIVEGMLDISWGVKRPIQLKIQDEKQIPSFTMLRSPDVFSKRGMTRWGEFDDLYHISDLDRTQIPEPEATVSQGDYLSYHSSTLKPYAEEEPESPLLYRTMSEATLVRKRMKSPMMDRKERQKHRASINGHFYNHETSIFTPAFGSETKVRINSNMRTEEVIEQLLQKFKIENSAQDFALYITFATGERKRLKKTDVPLLHRLLQGPSKENARIFLMDKDAEEISSDVAQYINFHFSLLESILQRLNEEEKKEIQRTIAKFSTEKAIILKCLQSKRAVKTETTV